MARSLEQLWELVRAIPFGKVAGYGALGRALDRPVSGLVVGKWMAVAPPDVPWWRVVASDGSLRTARRDPGLALSQKRHLEGEGVAFTSDRVSAEAFWQP